MNFLLTIAVYVLLAVVLFGVIVLGLSVLPTGGALPSGFVDGVHVFFSYVRGLNFLFPVDTLFQVLALILGFNLTMFVIKSVFWVFHLIRGNRK